MYFMHNLIPTAKYKMKSFVISLALHFEKQKPYIAMIIIQFIYAGMSLFSKAAISSGMKPSVFVAYRQAFATLALAPFAIYFERGGSHRLTFYTLCKIFIAGSCGIALTLNLHYIGLKYASATVAMAIPNTTPAVVFILAVCFRMERLAITSKFGMAKVLGAILGLSGAMAFTFYKGPSLYERSIHDVSSTFAHVYTRQEWIKGSLLLLASNMAWCLWLIMQAPLLKDYPAKLRLTTLQCGFSCVITTIYGAFREREVSSWKLGWDFDLLSVVYCGVVVTGISYWMQVWVVDKKGPVFTAIFGPLALIVTAFFSTVVFGETLHCGSLLGAGLLIGGLYSFLWGRNKEAQEKVEVSKEAHLDCIVISKSKPITTVEVEQQRI